MVAAQKSWHALVGLALDLVPGQHEIRVSDATGSTRLTGFEVRPKDYPAQRITLKDNSKVQLAPADEARAISEIATIQRLKRHWREEGQPGTDLLIPAEGRLSGRFGLRRFFNGEERAPHSGLDVAVPTGTPVLAPSDGQVLAVDDYFFNGKTVLIDHGKGLITLLCHLESIGVKAGETVSRGQRVGLSGSSGRASGPHLHWGVVLNGAMVNPALFVAPGKTPPGTERSK